MTEEKKIMKTLIQASVIKCFRCVSPPVNDPVPLGFGPHIKDAEGYLQTKTKHETQH